MNVIKNSRVKANFEFLGNAGSVLGSIVDSTGTGITWSLHGVVMPVALGREGHILKNGLVSRLILRIFHRIE
jgi:hypothetical protein